MRRPPAILPTDAGPPPAARRLAGQASAGAMPAPPAPAAAALLARGEAPAALAAYIRQLAQRPDDPVAQAGRDAAIRRLLEAACVAVNAGAASQALAALEHVLAVRPDEPDALYLQAYAQLRAHDPAAAARAAERLVRKAPEAARSWATLARVRVEAGHELDAEAALWRAIGLEPQGIEHPLTLAGRLIDQGRLVEADELVQLARARVPAAARPLVSGALVRQKAGDLVGARRYLLEADRLAPQSGLDVRLATRLSVMGQLGDMVERARAAADLAAGLAGLPDPPPTLPFDSIATGARFAFLMPFYGFADATRSAVLAMLGRAAQAEAGPAAAKGHSITPPQAGQRPVGPIGPPVGATMSPPQAGPPQAGQPQVGQRPVGPIGPPVGPIGPPGDATTTRPLRVGYLSANFGEHPVGHLLAPVLEAHDRRHVELFAYATDDRARDPGPYPARLRAAVPHWRELAGQSDAAIAAIIAADGLDVLVDLGGYLAGGRPGVLARRPASVQIHWIMHLGGMPAPFIDYTLTDRAMVPDPDPQHGHVLRLPHAFQPGYRQAIDAEPQHRAAHGLPAEGPILCAFNNPLKIDAAAVAAWAQILAALPGACLWLSGGVRLSALDAAFATHGIDPARLVYAPRLASRAAHLARHRLASLYLDSFTFGGATSAMDALLAGLPVLSRAGPQSYGRIGASFLGVLGLPELVATDTAGYVARAVALLAAPEPLAGLRTRLLAAVAEGPLFDATVFTRHLEAALAAVAARAAAGLAPMDLDIEEDGRVIEARGAAPRAPRQDAGRPGPAGLQATPR